MTAHITVYMLMNTTDFEAGALKTKAIGDELSNTMGTTGTSMGLKLSKGFEDGTKGIGGLFTKIGNMGSSMGIPLSGAFTKIGVSIQGADTKAATFTATMEGIGKISLFAGLAAGAAVALEGVKVWDAQEKAVVALDTVVKNTGGNLGVFDKQFAAVTASAKLFTKTDVADALSNLTMATGSSTKALSMMTTVEGMAVYKHESLAVASDQLDHILGGSTRTLLSWGINLNVSSGRLHSVQMEEEALQKAELNLQNVQQQHAAGYLEGVQYLDKYRTASLAVSDAQSNLSNAETTTSRVLNLLSNRFKGAQEALGSTFAGQIQEARSQLTNFAGSIGGVVVKGIEKFEIVIAGVVNFLMKFKAVAIALGAVIFGVPVAGAFMYLGSVIVKLISYVLTCGNTFNTFGIKARASASGPQAMAVALQELQKSMVQTGTETPEVNEALAQTGTAAQQAAVQVQGLQLSFEEAGEQAQGQMFAIDAFATALDPELVEAAETAKLAVSGIFAASVIGGLMAVVTVVGYIVNALRSARAAALQLATTVGPGASLNSAFTSFYQQGSVMGMSNIYAQQNQALAGMNAGGVQYSWQTMPLSEYEAKYKGARTRGEKTVPIGPDLTPETTIEVWLGKATAASRGYVAQLKVVQNEEAELNRIRGMSAKQLAAFIRQEQINEGIVPYTSPAAPKIPGVSNPPGSIGYKTSPLIAAYQSMEQAMQQALQTGTIQSLAPQMQGGIGHGGGGPTLTMPEALVAKSSNAGFNKLNEELKTLWDNGLKQQARQLLATYNAELQYYGALEANQQRIALADEIQQQAQALTDQTTIISDMATAVVSKITDTTAVMSAQNQKAVDISNDQTQITVDKLGERGLYGLNLVTQELRVNLDQITLKWTKAADNQAIVVAQTAKRGNEAVNNAKINEAKVAAKWDPVVAAAQKREDIMVAGGTSLQQAAAQSGLKVAQAQESKAEAIAAKAYTQQQDIANRHNALAQQTLTAIQNQGKIAEQKATDLVSIEQAKANTQFAGSGVHIEITGINPTDSNAVASATSWAMRTKVPK